MDAPSPSTYELQDVLAMESVTFPKKTHFPRDCDMIEAGINVRTLEAGQVPPSDRVFDAAPPNVQGRVRKILVAALIITANLIQMTSNGVGVTAALVIGRHLGINGGPSEANWIAASYPLTQGTFVLIAGRLGAVYGHKRVLLVGMAWLTIFTLANGFCDEYVSFSAVRAVSGVGGALIMPNAVAMLSIAIPPGKARNTCIGFFAASAPLGGWIGSLLAGVLADWRWIFWLLAIVGAVITSALAFILPKELIVDREGRIDYIGAALGVSSLILFSFVWNQAPSAGWATSYIIAALLVSVAAFAAFVFWEKKIAKEPIMPLSIFRIPTFSALVVVVLFSFMSYATSLYYMIAWQQLLRGWTALDVAIGWIPFAIGAIASTLKAAWLIARLPAQWIVAIGVGVVCISSVLLATMPQHQTYWVQTFPAIAIGSFCPDFVFTAAQIIASNSVSRKQQGVAASLIGTLNLYGASLGLGFAGTIESQTNKGRKSPVLGYRAALIFAAGIAAVAIVVTATLVRVPKNDREGWEDDEDINATDVALVSSRVAEVSGADAQASSRR